jgi:hypothetical protein
MVRILAASGYIRSRNSRASLRDGLQTGWDSCFTHGLTARCPRRQSTILLSQPEGVYRNKRVFGIAIELKPRCQT